MISKEVRTGKSLKPDGSPRICAPQLERKFLTLFGVAGMLRCGFRCDVNSTLH